MAAYDPDNIFANILRDEIPCHKLYEDDDALAFLDIMPRTEGHALVITKEPVPDLFGISPEGLARLMGAVQKLAPKIKDAVGADGVLIQQFNGAAAGQTVFHLHFHIIPRKEGVPMRPEGAKMADQDDLAATAEKIRQHIHAEKFEAKRAMDKDQSMNLYRAGRERWNAWAEACLAEKAEYEASGASLAEWEKTAQANFRNRDFDRKMDFDGYIFPGNCYFDDSTFPYVANFDHAIFHDEATFERVTFKELARFRSACFHGIANFTAITAETSFDIAGAQFHTDVPNFVQAHFPEAPRLDHIHVPTVQDLPSFSACGIVRHCSISGTEATGHSGSRPRSRASVLCR